MLETFEVPTGHICTIIGDREKPLEFLSIGDYGKKKNLKADFLGLTDEINGVPHGELLPLEEKWVITISTQYGCSMNCSFCDCPKVGVGLNATLDDLNTQVLYALSLHPEVNRAKRINLHYARMGEPTFNKNVIHSAVGLYHAFKGRGWGFHPVVSTMMPKKHKKLEMFLFGWLQYKNMAKGEAGLQLSINTTDEKIREETMPEALTLPEISDMMKKVLERNGKVLGRKITLNFALTKAAIDAKLLRELFDPEVFLCKLTPMHKTKACVDGGLLTDGGYDYYYPYKETEEALKAVGFDVLVFIPSKEEDESRITCGNVILANRKEN